MGYFPLEADTSVTLNIASHDVKNRRPSIGVNSRKQPILPDAKNAEEWGDILTIRRLHKDSAPDIREAYRSADTQPIWKVGYRYLALWESDKRAHKKKKKQKKQLILTHYIRTVDGPSSIAKSVDFPMTLYRAVRHIAEGGSGEEQKRNNGVIARAPPNRENLFSRWLVFPR